MKRLLLISAIGLIALPAAGHDRYRHEGRCRDAMHAAGDADASVERARNFAIKAWQEQVINAHGERFLSFDAAIVIDEHCDPARVGENNIVELKRCVVTARPCIPRRKDPDDR